MKKIFVYFITIISLFLLVACTSSKPLGATNSFSIEDNLENGNNVKAKVILLFGQSNATGISSNAYLKENIPNEYEMLSNGIDNVYINFICENGSNSSSNKFINVKPGMGASNDCFGPELGMAYELSIKYPNETIFIIKYSWAGSILDSQWLNSRYGRGELYNAAISFCKTSLNYLKLKGYDIEVEAVCWMQGESDSVQIETSNRYYKNTKKFVDYLRRDLSSYTKDDFVFIDAGIKEIDLYWIYYEIINNTKAEYADKHNNSIYFSTEDLGYTTSLEPIDNPDIAHYDSLSEFNLGRKFASFI